MSSTFIFPTPTWYFNITIFTMMPILAMTTKTMTMLTKMTIIPMVPMLSKMTCVYMLTGFTQN